MTTTTPLCSKSRDIGSNPIQKENISDCSSSGLGFEYSEKIMNIYKRIKEELGIFPFDKDLWINVSAAEANIIIDKIIDEEIGDKNCELRMESIK